MKKNTFNKKCIYALRLSVLFFLFLNTESVRAQVFQNDVLYVGDNTVFYMSTPVANYQFGTATGVSSSSTRTASAYGRLAFADGVVSTTATDNHFFDGYVTTYTSNDFIFPIGQSGKYAPAKVNATSTTGVDAAYINSTPYGVATSAGNGVSVVAVSTINGYWNIQRTSSSTANAKITLAWNSDITSFVGSSLNEGGLSIVGHTGVASSNWEIIPSTLGTANLDGTGGASTNALGTITSNADVDLSTYKFFTLARKDNCAPVVNAVGNPVRWNGTNWVDTVTLAVVGAPTETSTAILGAPFSGNLTANTLDMASHNVTLADGQVMDIVKGVTYTTGKVIMSSNASLVQRDDSADAPQIELTKNTRSLRRYDYTYFGSAVEENIFSQLSGAYHLVPSSNNRLYNHYKWTAGNSVLFETPYVSAWTSLNSGNFVTSGYGWISSVNSLAPFNTDAFSGVVSIKFSGTANNGVVPVTVLKSSHPDADHGSNYNLLANPYPSAITANKFLDSNTDIDGAVYVWEAKTMPSPVGTGYYNQSDYITYTKAGATSPSVGTPVFDGKIASGQGFMVKALVNNGSVTFNNCMRLSGSSDNTSFYRTNNTSSISTVDRFKLNLTSSTDDFNQVLIAYIPGLSMGYDRGYDASRNSTSGSQIFTIMGDTNQRLAIDARPAFVDTDIVPLGFTTSSPISSTNFQISIVEKEGVFQNDDVDVFIHDKLNNVYHNFDNGVFNFTASQSELLNRFDIVYQSSTLNNPDFDGLNVIVSLSESQLLLSSKEVIDVAYIFDVTGRLINKIKVNDFEYSGNFNHAQGVYIVRVELSNGQSVSNKVINK